MRLSLAKSSRTLVIVVSVMIIIVLAVFNLGSWFFMNRIEDSLETELATRLESVARLGAELVENSGFVDYLALGQGFTARLIAQPILEGLPAESDVQHVLLIDRGWRVLASSDELLFPSGAPVFFLLDDSVEARQAWNGEVVTSAVRVIEGSRFKTAYAPVVNTNDEVACLIVAEANADFFDLLLNFRRSLIAIGFASFVVLVIFAVFLVTAIALFMRTQENLRQSERLAAMGQMAASVAHEIRNPLSIIKNTAEVLRQKYGRDDQPDELFEFIPSEVRRLSRLVNDFLDFARDRKLNKRKGNLVQTVGQAISMVRNEDQSTGIEWHFNTSADEIVAEYDEDALTQVLINLLINACQAMNGSGRIDIDIKEEQRGDHQIHVSIRDYGPGLPASAERIFEPFFTTKTRGSGLGLAVSKQFIEKHNGRLIAESEKGKGTTMHIWLPQRMK